MSDSGHPSRFGYQRCSLCGAWRPEEALNFGYCKGRDWRFCIEEQARVATLALRHLERGWDANGAPTGVDENGDAT